MAHKTTETVKRAFLAKLAVSGSVRESVRKTKGISRATVYRLLAEDEAFRESFELARRESLDNIEDAQFEAAPVDLPTGKWLLRHHRPDVYGDKRTVDNRHSGTVTIDHQVASAEEQLSEFAEWLGGAAGAGEGPQTEATVPN